jgi:aminoglycoside phosphotransferase (APT) family kinase protein
MGWSGMSSDVPSRDQIDLMCKRGFGNNIRIASIEELHGGTFNTAHLITFADQRRVILRVAPPHTPDTYWEEAFLMRREHAMQPYFAPLATLMPKTLLADFTHQLIDRDYMFQSFIDGERWDHVMDELSPAESIILWEQFGEITNRVHEVRGEQFGIPRPGFLFPSWSEAIVDRLERTIRAGRQRQLEIPDLASIVEVIRTYPGQLDEIQSPRLLHGDLWTFNILIQRNTNGPAIVGILDADRSWWGDPMADWTMFILKHAEKEQGHSHF